MKSSIKGFTLIEILVASTILFTSIASVTLIYKSSLTASLKAEQRLEQAGVISILLREIQQDIRLNSKVSQLTLQGEGSIWGVEYSWLAEVEGFKSPADKFDTTSGQIERFDKRYLLWDVHLKLGSGRSVREFNYKELSWLQVP
ncbi:hypothetical protein CWB96_10895 [Pseudoalteromonas citrea]|uniref:Prepilin-type cleavage/methylation domain-containing protein n=1 Tax=Pseudoalteromonas citrea TaxID=43655 RepID=A0A5S3XP90_9GAMM|nr:type II secretion system protein [Pseudoalteromonas citrea]TMP45683.1 hypothetical protein CWB97_03540 [Pseudoalteromonas citrea]TMP59062.1 hypothetical protein CWB96_10895 [Pseudoalteromonas citrea]